MSNQVETLVTKLQAQGPQQFAAWNGEIFEAYLSGPLAAFQQSLSWEEKKSPVDMPSRLNFVQIIYEGVGAGWLTSPEQDSQATFLAHCVSLLTYQISGIDRQKRARVMQLVWNLGEGLAQEPQWLNQYAIARTDFRIDLNLLDEHLVNILTPVLTPLPPATWRGEFGLTILNFRSHNDQFLPGRVYLAAPALLCVEDRLNGADTQAILLAKNGQSMILPSVGKLDEYRESFTPPSIKANADSVVVNGQVIDTPLLNTPATPFCVDSGFIAVTAADSQRLWLVEAV